MKRLTSSLAAIPAAVALVWAVGFIPSTMAATTADAQHAVAAAKRPAPLLGVDVYSETNYSSATTEAYGSAILPYIRTDLKAQVVGLMWDLCTPSKSSNSVRACKTQTMSSTDIRDLATLAKKHSLSVEMRPIIRVGPASGWNNPHVSWEGGIKPKNARAWFTSLLAAERPYLEVARSVGVEQFVVGSELKSLQFSSQWASFLRKAHADCRCQVSYAAQDTQYQKDSAKLPNTSALGTDFYPGLKLSTSASQAKVTAAWEKSLRSVPESRLDRTSLDEVSIRATAGAYEHPATWDDGGKADATVQVRYFTAACATAAHYHMRALFFYYVPLNDNPAHPISFPAYFVKNAGSKAIAGCRKVLG